MALQYRAVAHARLHHKKEALEDVARTAKPTSRKARGSTWPSCVAAELADGLDEACEKLESAPEVEPTRFRPPL